MRQRERLHDFRAFRLIEAVSQVMGRKTPLAPGSVFPSLQDVQIQAGDDADIDDLGSMENSYQDIRATLAQVSHQFTRHAGA